MVLEIPYGDLDTRQLYTRTKSRLDNAIVELLLRIDIARRRSHLSRDDVKKAQRGLTIRDIRYAFGSYVPKKGRVGREPGVYRWLDPFRKSLTRCSAIDKASKTYSPQLVWNHCDKLRRMGVLSKKERRYTLGPSFLNNPEALRSIRRITRRAKQDDCSSNGAVTVIGVSKLDKPYFPNDIVEKVKAELAVYAEELWQRIDEKELKRCVPSYPFMKSFERPEFPLIVLDANELVFPED